MRIKIFEVELCYIWTLKFLSVPHILSFLIWRTWHNLTNVIISYGVHSYPHISSFIICCMRDIYHETNHIQFNCIFFCFLPEGILDYYSSCIEVYNSNDVVFVIAIKNIRHLSINEFYSCCIQKILISSFPHHSENQMYPSLFDI